MADDSELRQDLLQRIEARRAGVEAFLEDNRPRIRRRANVTIVLSSLSAAFTAGPALGGQSFAGSVQQGLGIADLSLDDSVKLYQQYTVKIPFVPDPAYAAVGPAPRA
jgi:hypothetical protein